MANVDNNLNPHTYTINGVEVCFPVKAYPSQVAMMSKVITALQRGQNSLLESPTGSGKSLALLCAALAWQRKESETARSYNQAVEQGLIEPEDAPPGAEMENEEYITQSADTGAGFYRPPEVDPEDDDFVDGGPRQPFIPPQMNFPGENDGPGLDSGADNKPRKIKKKLVPKIYFGTRTHKQITQIIRELRKTVYKDVKMTILASREHTCINKTVMQMKNKTEGCRELTDRKNGGGCPFQSNVKNKMANHHSVNSYRGTSDAWDIEDIVKLGKKVRACPYYGTRELKIKSEIIFCPYNYLVEPLIRKSMEISLKGQIVILDEAHNIEDSARSAASWQVTYDDVKLAITDINRVLEAGIGEQESHREMAKACSDLTDWIEAYCEKLDDYTDFNSASKVWNGTDAVALFRQHNFGPEHYVALKSAHDKVLAEWQAQARTEEEEAEFEKNESPKLKTPTVDIIENFILILGNLYMKDQKYRNDFRVALVKNQTRKQNFRQSGSGWISKGGAGVSNGGGGGTITFTHTVNFWCLNPAVTFDELKESVRSIVLTSGTLSPMSSFSSELDVKFPIQLEANHVIDKKQVWIGTLSHGPTGHCLNATFKNAESFAFQDELGRLAVHVCRTIAHGVLIFLPSYRMLQNVSDRWQNTGTWEEIHRKKIIISEPKNSGEFEACMRHFYDVIEETSNGPVGDGTVDGALFIAVCRGKVSEGLDFADNNARAVICVGIPFPNVKDIQVDLKMRYNDHRRCQIGQQDILTGKEWYEIQAFRALNQALGRCIRHRRDWGAIIMVDDRFAKISRYLSGLSKWVRSGVVHYSNFSNMMSQLANFNQNMVTMDQEYQHEKQAQEALAIQSKLAAEKENQELPPAQKLAQVVQSLKQKSENIRARIQSKINISSLQQFKVTKDSEGVKKFDLKQPKGIQIVEIPPSLPVINAVTVRKPILEAGQSDFIEIPSDEVTYIPESPQDLSERSPTPPVTCVPESPVKSDSEAKKPRLSVLNKDNSNRLNATNQVRPTATSEPSKDRQMSSSKKRRKLNAPPPKKQPIKYCGGSSDDDFV